MASPAFATHEALSKYTYNLDELSSGCLNLQYDLRYRTTDARTNGEVTLFQLVLSFAGYFKGEPSGYYGPQTMASVKKLQKDLGLSQTGEVGPQTRALLKAATCGRGNVSSLGVSEDLETARAKARDARRIADVKQLQLANELYFDANQQYASQLSQLAPKFLNKIPSDPLTGEQYQYAGLGSGRCMGYHIGVKLEDANSQSLLSDSDARVSDICGGSNWDFYGTDPIFDAAEVPPGSSTINTTTGRTALPTTAVPPVSTPTTIPPVNPYAPTITLTQPTAGSTYKIGDSIPLAWTYSNAPSNSQMILSLKAVQASGGGVGGGVWQGNLLTQTYGSGTKDWMTGPSYLDIPGVYEAIAKIRECDPRGCSANADFPGYGSVRTYATSSPVRFNMIANPLSPSCTITASKSIVDAGEKFTVSWTSINMNNPLLSRNGTLTAVEKNGFRSFSDVAGAANTFSVGESVVNQQLISRCSVNVQVKESATAARGTLTLSSVGRPFSIVGNVTKRSAQALCGVAGTDQICTWNGTPITYLALYGKDGDPKLSFVLPAPGQTIAIGNSYAIRLNDPSISTNEDVRGKYRVFLVKYSSGGQFERIYEATVVNSSRSGNDVILEWNFQTNEGPVQPGSYYFHAANTETAVAGSSSAYIYLIK